MGTGNDMEYGTRTWLMRRGHEQCLRQVFGFGLLDMFMRLWINET